MKALLIRKHIFVFHINRVNFGEFRLDSEWEGFQKFVHIANPAKSFICTQNEQVKGMSGFFFELFEERPFADEDKQLEITVFAASDLLQEEMKNNKIPGTIANDAN